MIVYTDTCLPCFHKKRFKEFKQFCEQHGLTFEIRSVRHNKEWRVEAVWYEIEPPFVVNGGKRVSLYGDLEKLL